MHCPSCGVETGPAHRFCFGCGAELPAPEANAEQAATAGERPKAVDKVAGALQAYRRHAAPLVEIAREAGAKGLLGASLARVATAVLKEHPELMLDPSLQGTVTLGFSDIEGSTAANERLGDERWLEVVSVHNNIVRQQLVSYGGSEVKSLGDGFMVAFPSARKAVRWAVSVQRAFQAHGDARPRESVAVRIGLHTGEAIKEGGDFFGADVAMAARVAGEAKGGQVLVSELVRQLVESSGEFAFGKPRKTALKGISGTQVVHEVVWRESPTA